MVANLHKDVVQQLEPMTHSQNFIFDRAATHLVRGITFPLWARRDHPKYREYRQKFEKSQFLKRDAIEGLQLASLNRLLEHAWGKVPFYLERMESVGLNPKIQSLQELSRLPITTKHDIQRNGAAMCARGFPESQRVRNQTGGSTGSPLQFYVDAERFDSRMASTWRHNRWAGFEPGDWCAELWGARLDQFAEDGAWHQCRNHLVYRTVPLNTASISETDFETYVRKLRRLRPRILLAYAQSAVAFCRFLRSRCISDIRFDSIITTAEVLLPEQRLFLEEVTGGKVFNRYGCREVSVIASECEFHTGMHVNAEALYVEIVPRPGDAPGTGRIVITDLLNRSMPLIRYEIGDVGSWAPKQDCPCGRELPLLGEVHGRTTDFLQLRDGRRLSGPALTLIVADMPDVAQVQFQQSRLDEIVLKVVPGRGFGAHTCDELHARLDLYLRGAAKLTIEMAEAIQAERSGKYRFVISSLGEPA